MAVHPLRSGAAGAAIPRERREMRSLRSRWGARKLAWLRHLPPGNASPPTLREQEVAGSNPATPRLTKIKPCNGLRCGASSMCLRRVCLAERPASNDFPQPFRFTNNSEHRSRIRLLIARQERFHVLPSTRRNNVLQRVVFSFCGSVPSRRTPKAVVQLGQSRHILGDPKPFVEQVPIHRRIPADLGLENPTTDGS